MVFARLKNVVRWQPELVGRMRVRSLPSAAIELSTGVLSPGPTTCRHLPPPFQTSENWTLPLSIAYCTDAH